MPVPRLITEFAPGAGPTSVPATTGDENYLLLDAQGGWAETPDSDDLDLTTTFDLRAEVAPEPDATGSGPLLAKWEPSANDATSWMFLMTPAGHLRLIWRDTSETIHDRTSTVTTPLVARLAVRAAGDFSGGAGAISFFTAPSLDGPWTVLGDIVDGGDAPAVATDAAVIVGAFDPHFVPPLPEPEEPGEEPEPPPSNVLFFDDFSTPELFGSNRGLDPAKWFIHDHGPQVNNEQQYYSPNAVTVSGGRLRITATVGGPGAANFTSGLVTTAERFLYRHGLVEIRLKAPGAPGEADGIWPSLFMLEELSSPWFAGEEGDPGGDQRVPGWPTTGKSEVDVWEWPGTAADPPFPTTKYHVNRHWNTVGGSSQGGRGADKVTTPIDMTTSFNTYAMEWTPDYLAFFFNGVEFHRLTGDDTQIPIHPMFLIINFAVGGNFAGEPDPDHFPATYEVDWVRVTSLEGEEPPPPSGELEQPDASNTGLSNPGALGAPEGTLTVNTGGVLIQNRDIQGKLIINADDVTVRNCRVSEGGVTPERVVEVNGTNALLEDTEVDGQNTTINGIGFGNYTARRLNIHGCSDGAKVGDDTTVESCFIHDLQTGGGADPIHADGVQCDGNGSNIVIRGNTISNTNTLTSCIIIGADINGDINVVLIERNWLFGTTGFAIHAGSTGARELNGCVIRNNRFGPVGAGGFEFGIHSFSPATSEIDFTGNVFDATGAPIPDVHLP